MSKMQIGSRASANAVIGAIMRQANGIGESKTNAKAISNIKGQNGHKVSTKAHSIKSVQNLRTVTTQYINYLKSNYGNKVVKHISKESMKEFLLSKKLNGGSLNTYTSIMAKVVDNLNKIGIDTVERKEIHDMRKEFKSAGINLQKTHINRAPESKMIPSIINNVEKSSPFGLTAKLQAYAGIRIDDAANSQKWRMNDNNTITIMQSKNGLNYTTMQLDDKLAQEIREAIAEGYKIDKTEYSQVLKEAVEKTGQEYHGSHSLRYSFAQSRVQELREEYGYIFSEALAQTSLEMAHSREEITRHYL